MLTRLRMLTLAILLLVAPAAGTVYAQKDYQKGRWWHTPSVAQELQLSESEIEQLDRTFNQALVRMIKLKSQVEVEQLKLRALMEQGQFDESAVMEQHRRQEQARTELADERFAFLLEVRKIVGHERFLKLLDIREEQRRQRHLRKNETRE